MTLLPDTTPLHPLEIPEEMKCLSCGCNVVFHGIWLWSPVLLAQKGCEEQVDTLIDMVRRVRSGVWKKHDDQSYIIDESKYICWTCFEKHVVQMCETLGVQV